MTAAARTAMYEHFAQQTLDMLRDLHPRKTKRELEDITYALLAFMEGLHVVFGSGDIPRIRTPAFSRHAFRQMLVLAGLGGER